MQEDVQTKQETILVVDDDARVVELLQITLTGRGYQVIVARDGATALGLVRERRPDLIVLDTRLPMTSGYTVLDTVRRDESLSHTPVVLISTDAATESRLQGLRLGADDYLVKPFSPRELIIRIRRILDRMQTQCQKYRLGLAGNHVAHVICDEIDRIHGTPNGRVEPLAARQKGPQ